MTDSVPPTSPGTGAAGSPNKQVALELRGITKAYPGVLANNDIDLELRSGEIHALLGENGAGKTTLMSILFGVTKPDSGSIIFRGEEVAIHGPRQALALGIGMVHQHFTLVPSMTAAENVALGSATGRPRRSHLAEVSKALAEVSRRYGLAIDLEQRVEDQSVGARQRLEILKLLLKDVDVLIFDEPTAVLTPDEWQELRVVLRRLADEGRAIVLITHKLGEVFDVADRCTVLRRGEVVGTAPITETDKRELVQWMVGRDVPDLQRRAEAVQTPGEVVLSVENLRVARADGHEMLRGVSLEVREGEVLGIAGVDGNGQSELVDAVTGMRPCIEGKIRIGDRAFEQMTPREYVDCGGALIPEDRHHSGVALEFTVWENFAMTEISRPPFSRRGILNMKTILPEAERAVKDFDVRAPSVSAPVSELSGGNRQKVVLAREFHRKPRLLVAAHPTRGLDIGASEFVHRQIRAHREAGGATLLVSAELDEVLALSDRIAVLVQGEVVGMLDGAEADREAIGALLAAA